MQKKCYFCEKEAEISRDNSYKKLDRYYVKCPVCTEYSIDGGAPINKISNWKKPIINLSNKAKSHFKETGEPFNFGSIEIDLFK